MFKYRVGHADLQYFKAKKVNYNETISIDKFILPCPDFQSRKRPSRPFLISL